MKGLVRGCILRWVEVRPHGYIVVLLDGALQHQCQLFDPDLFRFPYDDSCIVKSVVGDD